MERSFSYVRTYEINVHVELQEEELKTYLPSIIVVITIEIPSTLIQRIMSSKGLLPACITVAAAAVGLFSLQKIYKKKKCCDDHDLHHT